MSVEERVKELRAAGISDEQIAAVIQSELREIVGNSLAVLGRDEDNPDEEAEPTVIRDEQAPQPPQILLQALSMQGPLPPPGMLHQFEKALPGLADRIVTMAEKDAEARRECIRQSGRSIQFQNNSGSRTGAAAAP